MHHLSLIACHFVLDDPSRSDAVADAGDRQQADELRILPAIENDAGAESQCDLPRLAMMPPRPWRIIQREGGEQQHQK